MTRPLHKSYNSKKPLVTHFKVFVSECFNHVPNLACKKLEPKIYRCIFLGYDMELKGYQLYVPTLYFFQRDSQPTRGGHFLTVPRCWPSSGCMYLHFVGLRPCKYYLSPLPRLYFFPKGLTTS